MANKLNSIFIGLLLIVSIAYGFRHFFQSADHEHASKSTQSLFAASFPDEKGQQQAISRYAGKIIVLNFWATWCEPCRDEMPELSELHLAYQAKNVVVLGIAIDDVATITEFLKETSNTMKISYPLFAAEIQGMEIANNLGNNKGVLPYTVIIDADGNVAKSYFGRVTKPLLEETLLKLLKN